MMQGFDLPSARLSAQAIPPHILVVDDDREIRDLLARFLEPARRTCAPVFGRASKRIVSPSRVTCSCMMIASARSGSGAPVKMRHVELGASVGAGAPAALSPVTGNVQGPTPSRSAVAIA